MHNEDSFDLYFLPDFIMIIKSRRTRLAGNVARRGEREMHTGFWLVHLILFERSKRIQKNNINLLKPIGCVNPQV